MKNTLFGAIIAAVLITLGAAGAYVFLQGNGAPQEAPQLDAPVDTLPTEAPTTAPAQPTSEPQPTSSVPAGWTTYRNETHGLEISFPAAYEALDDSDNLYGWPGGIVLLYKGGQSYNLAVQVWNSQADFDARPTAGSTPAPVVINHNGKLYSFDNINNDPEVDSIVATATFQ